MALAKMCVFCGKPPQRKNREHVLPQWLLRLTGDPNRSVYLGRDWSKPELPKRVFSFGSFAFPACTKCNKHYSSLEAQAQRIVTAMLHDEPLAAADIDLLLDWLDKVRTGLWLGLAYLNGNHRDIDPQFAIASRIATRDRLLFVYRDDEQLDGISIAGVESPIFQVMPSCLVLGINHLHFFNASATALFAQRLGLPAPINRQLVPDRDAGFLADIDPGTGRVELPLLTFPTKHGSSQLYQPMFPHTTDDDKAELLQAFSTPYAQSLIENASTGRGMVLQVDDQQAQPYDRSPSTGWLPPRTFTKFELMSDLALMNGDWQEALYRDAMSVSQEHLSEDQRQFLETRNSGILRLHEAMMQHLLRQIEATGAVTRFDPDEP